MDDEAMKMARRIAAEAVVNSDNPDRVKRMILAGEADDWHGVRSALAAIFETRDRDAALADEHVLTRPDDDHQLGQTEAAQNIAAAIRSGQQFRKDV